ncbi:MAG: cytidylate kinase-like family protein [Clostridia bacterium]|nr:cytidylate kinase-like family protein [Clostridia bacterium]
MPRIITIGREFGSGGREIGKRLAEELQIAYYDNEIVNEIVKHSNLAEDYVNQILENNIVRYFPITVSHTFSFFEYPQLDFENKVYTAQNEVIKGLAEKSDCVIVGRCADYILREKNPFRLFIYADTETKIARCIEKGEADEGMTEKALKQKIKKVDRSRANYYEFFTGLKWGDKKNYDLCINTTNVNLKSVVKELASICNIYFEK